MVTLLQLCASLGTDLAPVRPLLNPSTSVTGVHMSELEDPTTYLDGGELLLTTGMPLRGMPASVESYVRRLRTRGVAAVGIGLGPRLDHVPPALLDSCAAHGLDVLAVPPDVGFQQISRAYWALSAPDGHADLLTTLGTQAALARAATRIDAVSAVVRGLAQALGGWAAYLPADGSPVRCWPENVRPLMTPLNGAVRGLQQDATLSPRTFALLGHAVIEYPIAPEGRVRGVLAVSPGRALTHANRQVLATVRTLLEIKAHQRELVARASSAFSSSVARLLAHGHLEAATLVADDAGLAPLPGAVRVLAVAGDVEAPPRDLLARVPRLRREAGTEEIALPTDAALSFRQDDATYFLLTVEAQEPQREEPSDTDPAVAYGAVEEPTAPSPETGGRPAAEETVLRAVVGREVAVPDLPEAVEQAHRALEACRSGRLSTVDVLPPPGSAERWVQQLASYSRADLVPTVREYLRHLGRWEDVSRVLGVHRNTVRHRIRVAEQMLGVTLTDPDVLAPLWLTLSGTGADTLVGDEGAPGPRLSPGVS